MSRILFFVGPNGCGKTRELVQMAQTAITDSRDSSAIANTPFVRFPRSRRHHEVFRVSPTGIVRVVNKNLDQFFDAEGRDTFDIADLLEAIGFRPQIKLRISFDNVWNGSLDAITKSMSDQDSLKSALEEFSSGVTEILLSTSSDSFSRSLRGRNRVVFKYLEKMQQVGLVSEYSLILEHRDRMPQKFSELSSGEQTLISTYLFVRANSKRLKFLMIDEPENSLHPDWQRRYVEFIHMALGYQEAQIALATHSPVLVSGAIASYPRDVDVHKVEGGRRHVVEFSKKGGSDGVEEILWEAFDTITPVNHFLSVELSDILQSVTDGTMPEKEAVQRIEKFKEKSYDYTQIEVLDRVIQNIGEFLPDA